MQIERIRIEGFGALSGLDLAWPPGQLMLVTDPNESGKTTLCEAIVAALYGLPRGRVGGVRSKELRRPRGGAALRVGLDLEVDGRRWSADRDLEEGTLRVVDRATGADITRELLRGGGRDVLGERVTGLTEPLFRTTAYVGQNVLDRDALDSNLTFELARIADSGGGEASVVRALRALADVRARMPDASSGPSVSVETEVLRLTRRVEEKRADVARLAAARAAAAEAAARLVRATQKREAAARRALLADIAVAETERRVLAGRLLEIEEDLAERSRLAQEAERLAADASAFSPEAVAELDRLREERGSRPELLASARAALASEGALARQEARERLRRLGGAALLSDEERARLQGILKGVVESAEETATAQEALEAQWDELRREGLAEDLKRLDALPPADRELLDGVEEKRAGLELDGVKSDRRAAEAAGAAAMVLGERRERLKRSRGLVVAALLLLPVAGFLAAGPVAVPRPLALALVAFAAGIGLVGALAWARALRYRLADESGLREEEAGARRDAHAARRRLSELRQALDRIARGAGFSDPTALVKAVRRSRAAEAKRRNLVERTARRDAAAGRRQTLEKELDPFREAIGCPAGVPSADDAQRHSALLIDVERAVRAAEARLAVLAREDERLSGEEEALGELERHLRESLDRVGIPRRLPLAEALLMADAGRRRAARRREILEVELPARPDPARRASEAGELRERMASLQEEVSRRLSVIGGDVAELEAAPTPEESRRAAELARESVTAAESERQAAERELALRTREGGERAREAEEGLAEAVAALERARLFRDAVDQARETLSAAASATYGDFRRGLAEASAQILSAWRLPYEGLEFGDDLSVTAIVRGGRLVTRQEIVSGLSTGAREQLHLTARLSALRYLGVGTTGVPLLLDDPLVGADDERFSSVMTFLLENVLQERPVLLVSCHGWRHERLVAQLPEDLRRRIRSVSLRSGSTGPPPFDGGPPPV